LLPASRLGPSGLPTLGLDRTEKGTGVLINVDRGEIVDEEVLADALQRDHVRGAALGVYVGEFEHTPTSRLWSDPKVLITPHISSASDQDRHGAISLFCDNLRAYRGRAAPECHRLGTGYQKLAG
jgi:phosphoglycerate dehydrogenase-like enzyme